MTREKKLFLIFLFNLSLMALEAAGGILSHSLALFSDAGHMLTDSVAVFLSWLAFHWSAKPATAKRTFGYHRLEILVTLINGFALLAISGYIFYEAFYRLFHPQEIKVSLLLIIAVIGLLGNLFALLVLRKESHENLNIKGAVFHILGDTLSSVGVILGGIIIALTGAKIVDSLVGILIGAVVLRGAISLIFESSEVLLESTPDDINIETLKSEIQKVSGVKDLHEIHIWTITSGKRAFSGHILMDNISTKESQTILCNVKELLSTKFNITHSTIEAECDKCEENNCEFSNHSPNNEQGDDI
jgi:cobalt-zinc-cadmium efflux system protein